MKLIDAVDVVVMAYILLGSITGTTTASPAARGYPSVSAEEVPAVTPLGPI
jgi:hypothetical protein